MRAQAVSFPGALQALGLQSVSIMFQGSGPTPVTGYFRARRVRVKVQVVATGKGLSHQRLAVSHDELVR